MRSEETLQTMECSLQYRERRKQQDEKCKKCWAKLISHWSVEGNLQVVWLRKDLYLSGRVNMREIEITTQHMISDGFDIGTANDPYRNFVYTSFQELATNVSHKRVGALAKKQGNVLLGKMCNIIAGDEMRHHLAYREFVKTILDYDPSEMMLAYEDMMRKKIVMPAQFMRESGEAVGSAFENFSNAAQRLGVYTTHDYVDILRKSMQQNIMRKNIIRLMRNF